ncbi:MAG: thymidylate synthase [Roseovarius sp.]|nr:thymidylate synthase [Roseovarius sp.]
MAQKVAGLLACAVLAACSAGSNPFNSGDDGAGGGGTGGGGGTEVKASVSTTIGGQVTRVAYNAGAGTLEVEGMSLDEVPYSATYRRAPALDQDGYVAFTVQEDAGDRHFTAYAGQSTGGAVRAAAISSPGPRNRAFMGYYLERDGAYDPPDVTTDSGLVTYAGRYVGLTNLGDPNGSDLLPPVSDDPELVVPQALIIHGDTFINADFADNAVEGNIFNRELLDTDLNVISELPSIVLVVTDIAADGTFAGTVEYDTSDPLSGADSSILDRQLCRHLRRHGLRQRRRRCPVEPVRRRRSESWS